VPLQPGQTIGHYRIERKIGEGGMGVVFLAEDTRLGRRIALKVLPAEMSADAGRRARFEREARAIAALNHPNIVTVYSVEEVEGMSLLTMELVEGRRLTELLARDGLTLPKLLDWSIGIAEAMVAAHRQGVVHRDLKPDNIMVTSEGRIKVLDFGLAKLRESAVEGVGAALPTASITEEGRILGTVWYMSPEQAEGKPVDQRSDIFSFGVVLYEMATGRRPFQGKTAVSTITSILRDTPPPPQQINALLPPQIGRIVRRCLAKEPERRYHSTEDLRNELRELKEDSESGELILDPTSATGTGTAAGRRLLKRPAVIAVVALLAVVAAGAGWLGLRREASTRPVPSVQGQIQMSRATTDGKVQEASISPDGRHVAYVRREGAMFALRLRQIVSGDEVQVVAPAEAPLTSPSFSADGDYVHYIAIEPGHASGWVYRVSVLGGTPQRIVDGVAGVAGSRDGRWLAITGGNVDESFVRIIASDGSAPRDLALRKGWDHFDSVPEWSSDGRALAVVSHRFGEPQQIVLIDSTTGQEQALAIPSLHSFGDLQWIPGRRALVVTGSELPITQMGAPQVWEVSTEGDLQPLTHDLSAYTDVSVTQDGSTVAAVQMVFRSGIDVAPVKDGIPGAFTELFPISESRAGLRGVAWLEGDLLAHSMTLSDVEQVSVTAADSKSSRALTTGASHRDMAVSRDGRTIVMVRADGDHGSLWRVDPGTGREQRLTDGHFDANPALSADGSWVVYSSAMETIKLLKMPVAGGTPVELMKGLARCGSISADDRDALCLVLGESGEMEQMLIPLAGGAPRPVPGPPATARVVRFGPDGRSITYLAAHDGADELWSLPAQGGEASRLVRFDGKEIADFAWSPDGKRLAIVKSSVSGDVVLLKRSPV
jgi:Tol biopolymer transport system component